MAREQTERGTEVELSFFMPDRREQRVEEDRELEYLASRAGIRLDDSDE